MGAEEPLSFPLPSKARLRGQEPWAQWRGLGPPLMRLGRGCMCAGEGSFPVSRSTLYKYRWHAGLQTSLRSGRLEDTAGPPPIHRQWGRPHYNAVGGLSGAPPLTQGEAAAGPGPHQPLTLPVIPHATSALSLPDAHTRGTAEWKWARVAVCNNVHGTE